MDEQIFVGEESGYAVLGGLSVVVSSYGEAGRPLGVVGVIDPTRMVCQNQCRRRCHRTPPRQHLDLECGANAPNKAGVGGKLHGHSRFCTGEPRAQWTPVSSPRLRDRGRDRKSTRLNSSHVAISYAVFCLKKKTK